jgi:hypothetical protein
MTIKEAWYDKFLDLLWEHHTCDWEDGNKNPYYPFQLVVAYFDWVYDGVPEETPEEAFSRYLETLK